MKSIGKRIKELRKREKYSQQFIASKLNISQSAYSLIESSHNNVMVSHVLTLSELYDVSTDYILRGKNNLVQLNSENGFVPFINLEAAAGVLNTIHSNDKASEWDWYRIPGFNTSNSHLLFEVEGDSMTPTLHRKDIILCEAKDSLEEVADESLVVVVTDEGIITKRFERDGDYCVLKSDNEKYGPLKLHRMDIKAIMSVEGKTTKKINDLSISSTGKLNQMEQNMKDLESKLEHLSKNMA